MMSENEIRERISRYLAGNESVNDFANWLSRESSSVRYQDVAEFNLVAPVQNWLEEYFDNLMDESMLKSELRGLVNSTQIQEYETRLTFDDIPAQPVSSSVKPSLNSVTEVHQVSFAL